MTTTKGKADALDAGATTEDGAAEQMTARPLTDAERAYLAARVVDLEAAVEKVQGLKAGAETTLKTLKSELAEARKAERGAE